METFSIRKEFLGAKVLLTGASGYVGSVVLEQLLRCTGVDTVYCLIRPKRGQDPQQRLDKVLHSALFHKVRETPAIKRARAVAGDIMVADLGLSQDDRAMIESEVDIVLHCAADITLDADIQVGMVAAAWPGHYLHPMCLIT
jgi:fatty acyl-CoA reductase